MINIFIAFWIGTMAGAMCFAISNGNKQSETRDLEMWKMRIEQERIETMEELKERIASLEQELRIKDIMIERMADRLANMTSESFDSVIETFQDIAKEIVIEEATR